MRACRHTDRRGVSVLKKVLIGLAVILVLAAGAGGYEAYQLYTGAANLLDLGHPTLPSANPCTPPASAAYAAFPKLLPWSAGTSASATPTPTPAKVKACLDPENNLPTLSDRRRINILLLGTDTDCK